MKDDRIILSPRRLFSIVARIVLPFAATWAPLLICIPLNRWILYADSVSIPLLVTVLLLLLAWETLVSHLFEKVFDRNASRLRRIAFLGRLAFLIVYYSVMVFRTARTANTADIYSPLIGWWPWVLWMAYYPYQTLGLSILFALGVLYLYATSYRRRFRLTTTVILPWSLAIVLFHVFYAWPSVLKGEGDRDKNPAVQRIFPSEGLKGAEPFRDKTLYPRDLFVSRDDRFLIASFGPTFLWFAPQRDWNLIFVDFEKKRVVPLIYTDTIRRFYSECEDRIFAAPWHWPFVYMFEPDNLLVETILTPATENGALVEEYMHTYHACDMGLVFVANCRNPVVDVIDAREARFDRRINLVGIDGIRVGDIPGVIFRSRQRHRLYVGLYGAVHLVEIDDTDMTPLRTMRLPVPAFDAAISPDEKFIYAPAFFHGRLFKVDVDELQTVDEFSIPVHCRRVIVSADSRLLFVSCYLTGEVLVLDAQSGDILRRYYIGPKVDGIALSENFLYATASNGIWRISLKDLLGPQR